MDGKRFKPSTEKLIAEALAIQEEEAKDAGTLGFMARGLVQATLPHRNPKASRFTRRNGHYTLSITALSENIGLPYGTYPRLLLAWISTEAIRTKNPELILGNSLSGFMRQLGLIPSGGRWGTIHRLRNQMARLFGSAFSCQYINDERNAGINMVVVEAYDLWWEPKKPDQATLWDSTLKLNQRFYDEITASSVPVDMRALKALKGSSLGLDIYMWATWRVFGLRGKQIVIPWPFLQAQFGSDYADTKQGRYEFKRKFKNQLTKVLVVYPDLNVMEMDQGLLLRPSRPHVRRICG